MPVPDTGAPSAAGFAEALGHPVPRGHGPQPLQRPDVHPAVAGDAPARRQRQALSPLREVVRDKRLVVVDDSIVRGTTTKQIVALLRRAGATEVHLRISAPPIYHPCFYGIDTAIETELIAGSHTVDEIREFVGADSLGYLSIAGVLAALDLPYDRFCFACFDGNYPEPVPYDTAARKFVLETPERGCRVTAPGDRISEPRPPASERAGGVRRAGVDVAAGERAVELMRASVASTRRPEVLGGLGGFASAIALPTGIREPVVVSSTDGVGRRRRSPRRSAGFDTIGDRPRGDVRRRRRVHGRRAARVPGLHRDRAAGPGPGRGAGRRDRRGLPPGGCRADRRRDGRAPGADGARRVRPGRVLHRRGGAGSAARRDGRAARRRDRGLASRGLHANGYSLVRRARRRDGAAARRGLRRGGRADPRWRLRRAEPELADLSLGEVLLTPTRIYARRLLAIRAALERGRHEVRGVAHVTGGGLPGNVPRALPEASGHASIRPSWPMPSVMR